MSRCTGGLAAGAWPPPALDNCGCVAALVGLARQLYQARPQRTTYLAATVWEEYNQRAAAMAVRRINPIGRHQHGYAAGRRYARCKGRV